MSFNARNITLFVLLLITGWGCTKSDDSCSQFEVPSFQVLITANVLLTNSNLEPLEYEDNLTLITELQNCDGTIENRLEFKGSTDGQGLMTKDAGFSMDNKEDKIRIHAYYGNHISEDIQWIDFDDTKGTQGQIHVQLKLTSN